jgi:hypothetical protein
MCIKYTAWRGWAATLHLSQYRFESIVTCTHDENWSCIGYFCRSLHSDHVLESVADKFDTPRCSAIEIYVFENATLTMHVKRMR